MLPSLARGVLIADLHHEAARLQMRVPHVDVRGNLEHHLIAAKV